MSSFFSISEYSTLVFDCDGVVLDSNKVKTDAFYQATLPYGEVAAKAMVEYHVANGGVSRYKKFTFFLKKIAPKHASGFKGPDLDELLKTYADHVREGLLTCDMAPGLETLRQKTSGMRWLIVSGGDQDELRDVFARRGIFHWFDGGIFGSPDSKDDILLREVSRNNLQKPALFLGDSKYDYQAATDSGLDFVFLTDWSEVEDFESFALNNSIICMCTITDFLV